MARTHSSPESSREQDARRRKSRSCSSQSSSLILSAHSAARRSKPSASTSKRLTHSPPLRPRAKARRNVVQSSHGSADAASTLDSTEAADQLLDGCQYFTCQWRPAATLHQSWQRDAKLLVWPAKRTCSLQSITENSDLAINLGYSSSRALQAANILLAGHLEIQLEKRLSAQQYIQLGAHSRSAPSPGSSSLSSRSTSSAHAQAKLTMRRPGVLHRQRFANQEAKSVEVVIPSHLAGVLQDFQVEGVRWLYETVLQLRLDDEDPWFADPPGAVFADAAGSGKKLQLITLLTLLLLQPCYGDHEASRIGSVVIVCAHPNVTLWRQEFEKWSHAESRLSVYYASNLDGSGLATFLAAPKGSVLVISYDQFRKSAALLAGPKSNVGLLVCDDAQRLFNVNCPTAHALNAFACTRRIAMTSKLDPSHLTHLYALVSFAKPGLLDEYIHFEHHYQMPIEQGDSPNAFEEVEQLGQERSDELALLLDDVVFCRDAKLRVRITPSQASSAASAQQAKSRVAPPDFTPTPSPLHSTGSTSSAAQRERAERMAKVAWEASQLRRKEDREEALEKAVKVKYSTKLKKQIREAKGLDETRDERGGKKAPKAVAHNL